MSLQSPAKIRKDFAMKTLPWIGALISIIGLLLNASKSIWCWPVWTAGNLIWMYMAWHKKDWPQLVLWSVFTIFNLYGWYQWATA